MCNLCCREVRSWCKSFTQTEVLLSILEGVLLLVFIGFLTFLVLHFLACYKQEDNLCVKNYIDIQEQPHHIVNEITYYIPYSSESPFETSYYTATTRYENIHNYTPNVTRITVPPDVQCSWTPSKQTEATTHYYESNTAFSHLNTLNDNLISEIITMQEVVSTLRGSTEIAVSVDESDVEEPEPLHYKFFMALVKLRPLRDTVFGCTLTIVSDYWMLTAASCIESIEEVDSLDSFVIMERYGGPADGITHALDDIQIHPSYRGTNRSYDLAALKSEDSLLKGGCEPVELPRPIDRSLVTPGESLTVFGFGKFRRVSQEDQRAWRRLRAVRVHAAPARRCARPAGLAPRHLWRAHALARPACGAAALCAGVLHARGLPCNYCAGSPLLAGRRLLGVMAADDQCGVACEPALYVDVANLRGWLLRVLRSDQ